MGSIKELILEEEKNGFLVIAGFEGLQCRQILTKCRTLYRNGLFFTLTHNIIGLCVRWGFPALKLI